MSSPRCRARPGGSVIVEFALTLSLLGLLALVVGDAGAAWRIKAVLNTAASEGARAAAATPNLQPNDPQVLQVIDAILAGAQLDPARGTRTVQFGAPLRVGQPVIVRVSQEFEPLGGGLLGAEWRRLQLAAQSTMRYGTGVGVAP